MFSYVPTGSGIHRADALSKLAWFVVVFVGAFLVRPAWLVGLYLCSALGLLLAARLRFADLIRTWAIFLVLFAAVYPLLVLTAAPDKGVQAALLGAAILTARMLAVMTAVSVLTSTTTPHALAVAFGRLRLPFQVGMLIELSLVLIPESLREFRSVVQMQQTRGYRMKFSFLHPVRSVHGLLPLIAPMIFRMLQRAWDLAISLETRGFFRKQSQTTAQTRLGTYDALLLSIAGGLIALSVVFFFD